MVAAKKLRRPFFPKGLALGENFCNRIEEKATLKKKIMHNQHIVLMSPRRYGKTSLITQVVIENRIPFCAIDMLPIGSNDAVKNAILLKVGELLGTILPKHKKALNNVITFLNAFNPTLTLTAGGQKISLSSQKSSQDSISEVLVSLDKVAKSLKKRCVVIMDEFQQISTIKDNALIEASIRHAVERSENVSYIFSGSNRRLLKQMFNSKNRPFYQLCDLMVINRIEADDYKPFLQKSAINKWKIELDNDVLDEILLLTACHPRHVNALCSLLWLSDKKPNKNDVTNTWKNYIETQISFIAGDIDNLSPNQRTLLAALPVYPTYEPLSQKFSRFTNLSPSSIQQALKVLIKNDLVYKSNDNRYRVLDPAMETYLLTVDYF